MDDPEATRRRLAALQRLLEEYLQVLTHQNYRARLFLNAWDRRN